MSQYLAGGLMILLLCATALLGLEAYSIYDANRMVEAAVMDGQMQLAMDGGLSPAVATLVRHRVEADGGNLARLHISGSPPHAPYGKQVWMQVVYEHPYSLLGITPSAAEKKEGIFRIKRTAVVISGWQP